MQGQENGIHEIEFDDGADRPTLELPETLGRQATHVTAAEDPPETMEELAEAFARTGTFQPGEASVEDLLVTDDSRHEVRLPDRTVNTYCFLDALALAVLEDREVEITTRPPGTDAVIELTASRERIQGGNEEMVVSFGFAPKLASDGDDRRDRSQKEVLDAVHRHGCPKMNLFPDGETYEAWASEDEAVTIPIGLPRALALVHDFVDGWTT